MFNKIQTKLIVYLLLIGMLPLGFTLWSEYQKAIKTLKDNTLSHLTSIRESKKRQAEDYFREVRNNIKYLAKNTTLIAAMRDLSSTFQDANVATHSKQEVNNLKNYYRSVVLPRMVSDKPDDLLLEEIFPQDSLSTYFQHHLLSNRSGEKPAENYFGVHDYYHRDLFNFLDEFGFHDILLVDNKTGYVVYSAAKQIHYATNLFSGSFANSKMAQIFRDVRDANTPYPVKFCDFERYAPSNFAPSSFIATPIFDGELKVGTLIFQISIEEVDAIMTGSSNWMNEGLGMTGKSYIVGEDFTMRSDSRFLLENQNKFFKSLWEQNIPKKQITLMNQHQTSVLFYSVESDNTKAALAGETNTVVSTDHRNVEVLSSYTPLNIPDVKWALLAEIDVTEALLPIEEFTERSRIIAFVVAILVITTAVLLSNSIANPIRKLEKGTRLLAAGDFSKPIEVTSQDEIGHLTHSFNNMSVQLREQRNEIESHLNNIAEQNGKLQTLVTQVQHKNEEIVSQRDNLEIQQKKLEKAYRDIRGSISYAQRIQDAKLPQRHAIQKALPHSCLFFKPRDLVSGDFYWFAEVEGKKIIAAVDCTGHGVPGAFMSMIGTELLHDIVEQTKVIEPDQILNNLHLSIRETLKQRETENRDGMDMSICVIDEEKRKMSFAGAKNPLIYIQYDYHQIPTLHYIKGDKMPIGGLQKERARIFTKHEIDISRPTYAYIFTDGFQDQFGGPEGRKFMIKRMKDLLFDIHTHPFEEQESILSDSLDYWMNWKGRNKENQLDDILVMGFKLEV